MLHLWISREYKVPLKVEAIFVGTTPAFNLPPNAKQRTGTADPIRNIEPVEDLRNSLFSVTLRSPKLEKACYEQAKALVAEAMRILEDVTGLPSDRRAMSRRLGI